MSSAGVITSPARKRRRRRAAISCEPCRLRKVGCDKGLPCGTCARARNSMLCVYREDVATANSEKTIGKTRPLVTRAASGRIDGASAGQRRPSEAHAQNEATYTDSNSRHHQSMPHSPPTTSQQGPSIAPPIPHVRQVPGKTKLFGQTHWVHIAEKFPISGKMHPVEIEPHFAYARTELFDMVKQSRSLRLTVKAQHSVNLSEPVRDLSTTLPTKTQCEDLAQCYFRTFEPIYRILHVPSFWKDFNHVWEPDSQANTSSVFLMQLFLVLALGTTFYTPRDDDERDSLRRLAQTWIQSVQWLLTGPSENIGNTIYGLQVCCLLLLARQTTFNCAGSSAFVSAGSVLRTAVSMGLHRNPAMFPSLSPYHREFRKRIWATVLELTSQSCLTQGLPLGFGEDDYDTPLPSNYNDVDLDPEGKTLPTPTEGVTDSSLQIILAKTLPCRLRVVRMLNDFRNRQPYDTTLKLGTELRAACREIAGFFQNLQPTTEDSRLFPTEFHRRFLDIHVRRFSLYLHRPFMLQARVDPQFYLARKVCVESSMAILGNANELDLTLPFEELDDLTRMSIVGRGLYKGALCFDAIMVVALEIITQLQDESAPPQTALDALDEMARAGRVPLVGILRRLEPQLLLLVSRGGTSLKRYLFSAAYLSQIGAMESGQPIKQTLAEATAKALKKCCAALRERVEEGPTPQESLFIDDTLPSDMFSSELGFIDFTGFDWGNANSMYFPGLNEGDAGSQSEQQAHTYSA